MPESFSCPRCCAKKELRGKRRQDEELVDITCLSCGHEWTHDPWLCTTCGDRLVPERRPLLQKARGTQQSVLGYNTVKVCPTCDPPEQRRPGWMSASE
jgi:hypothetical protein